MRRRVVKRITQDEPDRSERMLQAAVDALREALDARIVYGFSVARDGELHCVAVSPRGRARPANIAPMDHPESVSLLCKGVAGVLDSWAEPDSPGRPALFVPWWSEDGPVGAALAVVDEVPDAVALRLASAHGASVGSRLTAERYFGSALRRLGMLEQLSALVENVFDAASDAIVQVNLDGMVARWNSAAERLYGWSAREVVGTPIVGLNEGWTQFACSRLREIASSALASEVDVTQVDRNGLRFPARMTLLPMLDETGNPESVVAIARATGLPTGGDEPRTGVHDLADIMVRAFTGPLTAIIGYAELLSRSAITEDSIQRARVTRGLCDRCEELAALLEDLILLSRLDTSALKREPVDLAEMCRTLVSSHAAQNRGVRFNPPEVRGEGLADADRRSTEASVQGLLRCVTKYCSAEADVGFMVSANATTTALHVEMREPNAAAAADLTERLEQLTDYQRTGENGLGLQIARLVAEAHGGTLTIAPSATPGPTFTLELPAHAPLGPAEEERWNSTMV